MSKYTRYVTEVSQRNWAIVQLFGLLLAAYMVYDLIIMVFWGFMTFVFMVSLMHSENRTESSYDLIRVLTIPMFLGFVILWCYCGLFFCRKIWRTGSDILRYHNNATLILTEDDS